MASKLAKKAGMKVLEQHLQQYTPRDPLYEEYVDDRGVKRQRKRELPPGLSKRDEAILKKVKKRAHYLDKGFTICGWRFGWTFVIGLVPVVGDVADAVLNYTLVLRVCKKAELPSWLVHKMLFNNAVSAAMGFVPFLGDILLAVWRANSRNAFLLEEFLRVRGEEYLKAPTARIENPAEIHPGAGKREGEYVDGKIQGTARTLGNPSGSNVAVPGAYVPRSKGKAKQS